MSSMAGRERILEEASAVIKGAPADGVEVVFDGSRANTVRFASSTFHQGGTETDCLIHVRAIIGRRFASASTNGLGKAALKECLDKALDIARHIKEEDYPLSLPGPGDCADIPSFFASTAGMTDREKVAALFSGFKKASHSKVLQSGILSTVEGELAVVNSNGVAAYHPYTSAFLSVVSTSGNESGFKCALSKDVSRIDIPAVMDESASGCLRSLRPRDGRPGAYRVLLEPPAVSELMHWLSYISFGAKNFQEGSSFMSNRLGEKVAGANVTIYDDGTDPAGMSAPFDWEGTPKRRLDIIDKGVARAVAFDSFTASMKGGSSTGHAAPPNDEEGPMPGHIFMEAGTHTRDELLEMLGDGLLIKSFHYVNGLLNPKETLMTGMTRHGTFLVEGGRVKHALKPMRFTENIIKAFNRIIAASGEREAFPNHGASLSSITVPSLLIDGFRFTS